MKIQLKRSNVLDGGAAKEPTAAQMEFGELAVNYNETDPSIFMKDADGNIVRIAGNDAVGNDPGDIDGYPDIGDGGGATLDDRYLKLGADAGTQVVQSTNPTILKSSVYVGGTTANNSNLDLLNNGYVQQKGIQWKGSGTAGAVNSKGLFYSSTRGTVVSVNSTKTTGEQVRGVIGRIDGVDDSAGNPVNAGDAHVFIAETPLTSSSTGNVNDWHGFSVAAPGDYFEKTDIDGTIYGFYSGIISGNAYSFFAEGNAPNFLAGNTYIGGSTSDLGVTTNINLLANGSARFAGQVDVKKFSSDRPADFYRDSLSYYGVEGIGDLTSQGTFSVHLTCNGYRDVSDKWVSFGYGNNGAAQVELHPNGIIRFKTESSKPTGGSYVVDTKMTITEDGDVGIGIDNPSAKLEIRTPAGTPCELLLNERTTTNSFKIEQNATEARIQTLATQPLIIAGHTSGASNIRFETKGVERVRIDDAGYVGINKGGAAAESELDVKGLIQSSGGVKVSGGDINVEAGRVTSKNSPTGQSFNATFGGLNTVNLVGLYASAVAGTTGKDVYGVQVTASLGGNVTATGSTYGLYSNIAEGTDSYNFFADGTATNFLKGSTYIGGDTARNTFELWKSTLTEEQIETLEAGTFVAPANVSLPGDGSFARQWYYDQQDEETQALLDAGTLEYPTHLAAATFTDTFALGDNTKINLLSTGAAYFAGRVGIGTDNPSTALHISGTGVSNSRLTVTRSGSNGVVGISNNNLLLSGLGTDGTNGGILFFTGGTEAACIQSSGKVGIGTNNPQAKLDVNGDIKANNVTFNLEADDNTKYTATTNEEGEQTLVYNGAVLDVKERLENTQAVLLRIKATLIQPAADANTLRARLLEALDILVDDDD